MKKFNSSILVNNDYSLRFKTSKGIFNALSNDSALFYNNETEDVESCLWRINNQGLLVITFSDGETFTYVLIENHPFKLMLQEVIKKENGKYSKKDKEEWVLLIDRSKKEQNKGNLKKEKKSLKEIFNPIILLILVAFYFTELLALSLINAVIDSVNISNIFIFIIVSFTFLFTIKMNYSISEFIYKKIQPYIKSGNETNQKSD